MENELIKALRASSLATEDKNNNELRKKRVLEGIAMLEIGKDPSDRMDDDRSGSVWIIEQIGVSELGCHILYINQPDEYGIKNGFKEGNSCDTKIMLHNWKRFYELIKDLK